MWYLPLLPVCETSQSYCENNNNIRRDAASLAIKQQRIHAAWIYFSLPKKYSPSHHNFNETTSKVPSQRCKSSSKQERVLSLFGMTLDIV